MAGDWIPVKLGHVSINHDAVRVPVREADRTPGPYPYYGASGIVDHVNGYLFDGEYLLVAEDGENLRTRQTPVAFIAKGQFWVNNHAHILQGNSRALTRYLRYALTGADIAPFLTGAVMPKLTQFNLHQIPVLLPSLHDQAQIVEVLQALDDKIELNRKVTETQEAIARALFQSWFVDFDPVHAKGQGGQLGLSEDLAALFPDSLEADGMPAEWFRASLGNLVSIERATQDPTVLGETLVDHFSLPAFDAGRRPVREPASEIKSLKVSIEPPLVLFSKLNPETPRVWPVLASTGETMLASTEFLALRPRPNRAPLSFIASLLASNAFRDKAAGMVTGTSKSHQRAQPGALLESSWIVPTASVLAAFDEIASPMLSRAEAARNQSDILAALRDILLPKLISGELRIADVEQRIAAA